MIDAGEIDSIMNVISKGDTSHLESMFKKPGGRKFFESIAITLIVQLPGEVEEKKYLFQRFRSMLTVFEQRLLHQLQGQKILEEVL